MTLLQIFGVQVALSFVVWGLIAAWYAAPRLATLPLDQALQPLLVMHAFRHVGLVFLVPTVAGPSVPASFSVPAAYGDFVAGLLALAALLAVRGGWPIAIALVWVGNAFGLLDLINAFYQGLSARVVLGAAYFIPTVVVPALVVSHLMIFGMLLRRSR